MLAGNTRDEGKLFPPFPAAGRRHRRGRIVTDATRVLDRFQLQPECAADRRRIEQWIPPYLPVETPVTGFNARAEQLNRIFFLASRDNVLNALKAQQPDVWYYQFNWDEQPAPWNDIYGAAHVFDLPFVFGNFGPSLYLQDHEQTANKPGRLELSDAMMAASACSPATAIRTTPHSASPGRPGRRS